MNVDLRGTLDQEEALRGIAERDSAALEELYAAYGAHALVLARHLAPDEAAAEQAVFAGFLDIWQHPGEGGDLYARLLKAVHRRAVLPDRGP